MGPMGSGWVGEGRRGTAGADGGGTRVVRRGERTIPPGVIVAACSNNTISPSPLALAVTGEAKELFPLG